MGKHTTSIPYIISSEKGDRVVIGDYTSIGHGTILITHPGIHVPPKGYENHRVTTYPIWLVKRHGFDPSYYIPERRNFVAIGSDVTLGANAIILPGVSIGNGAIVGAGAVVTHDVPPYAIVARNPAKTLRYRYKQDQISKLLKIAWWNWSEEKISKNMDYFLGEVQVFIDKFYEEFIFQDKLKH